MTTVSYGLTTWTESDNRPKKSNNNNEDFKPIPFIKFKRGKNTVRFITDPYGCYKTKIQSTKASFPVRVKTAYPGVERTEDPILKHGFKEQRRYYVGVLYKGTPDNPEETIGVFEMGQGPLYNQLKSTKEDDAYPDSLRELDIRINCNPDANDPGSYYIASPLPPKPMSESELKLEEEYKEQLIGYLDRLCAPNSVEKVEELIENHGWTPEKERQARDKARDKAKSNEEADTSSSDNSSDDSDSDDDYDFSPPEE